MSDTSNILTQAEFAALISAYGGAAQNWPDDRRAAMLAYCQSDPTADAMLSREMRLDDWLDGLLDAPPADLEARLIASMEAALQPGTNVVALPQRLAPTRLWAFAGALAACFVAGFISGPVAVDMLSGGPDLLVSLDILSDAFLPTEPL